MENTEKNQIKLFEMKNTIWRVKTTLDCTNCRLNITGNNKISKPEGIDTIQNRSREKREF